MIKFSDSEQDESLMNRILLIYLAKNENKRQALFKIKNSCYILKCFVLYVKANFKQTFLDYYTSGYFKMIV